MSAISDPRLIVALDVPSADEASALVEKLGDSASFYKVGMELYASAGMGFVKELLSGGKKIFLDMKYYDIGETVKRTVSVVAKAGVHLLTLHGSGAVVRAAAEGRGEAPLKLLAVTVLTSLDESDIRAEGYNLSVRELVELRVRESRKAGADGLICSPLEVARVRELAGPDALLVTPGVRSAGADTGDQKRVATPADALRNGATHLVLGRQITRAADPKAAIQQVLAEIA